MAFVAAVCPSCAGALQLPDDRDAVKCMYCGVEVVVRQAIQLVAGNTQNLFELATSALAGENYSEAYDYFNKVLELEPRNSDAWFGKGTAAGLQSNLKDIRLSEMLVAYENVLKYCPESAKAARLEAISDKLREVAMACYVMSYNHTVQFAALDGTWGEHLGRCLSILPALQAASGYSPENKAVLEDVVRICRDNIRGIKYTAVDGTGQAVHLTVEYEKDTRALMLEYGAKLKSLDPDYEVPQATRQTPSACFVVAATLGDERHPSVLLLRRFRDESLVKSPAGRAFVAWYGEHGPQLARFVERSRVRRAVAYVVIVAPAVAVARAILRWHAPARGKVLSRIVLHPGPR